MERFYSFKCISYANEEHIRNVLSRGDISHWARILHDKDIKDNGEWKEKHNHIIVVFKANKSIQRVRDIFQDGTDQNTLVKVVEDIKHDFDYLTHKNDQDKYQYSIEDVKTDNGDYWKKVTNEEQIQRTSNEEFIEDLMSDEMSYKGMAIKYGRDFIKNRKAYMQYRVLLRAEERKEFLQIFDETEIESRAEEEQKSIITRQQFKQYYGEQQSINTNKPQSAV